MAIKEIIEFPDERLRLSSARVSVFDNAITQLATDLIDTLNATSGIGLCAPQIGHNFQALVVDVSEDKNTPELYFNPEILEKAKLGIVEETCLSVPGVKGNVIRATEVRVRAFDQHGNEFERELTGMAAVCVQHEMDHLVGKLFVDRLSIFRRLWFRARYRRHDARAA